MSRPPSPASFDGAPRPGDLIAGKYRVSHAIGQGGMGVLVAALHVELRQEVALKFLHREMAKRPELVRRFLREAQAAARLRSEHVARVLDVGRTEDGLPFLVMELLEGIDLAQKLRRDGALPIAEAALYVLQTCGAIGEAHAQGVVHRDLKPANLFLTRRPDGTPMVKVVDFGISKIASDDAQPGEVTLTTADDVLGSPLYMAPEQIRAAHGVDGRADLWSLGAILHRLVSNESAFGAPTPAAILAAIVADPPTPLRVHAPHAPAALEAIVLRCLTRDLEARWQTAAELADALRPFVPPTAREVLVPRGSAALAYVEPSEPGVGRTGPAAPRSLGPPPAEPATMAGGSVTSVTVIPQGRSMRIASSVAVGGTLLLGVLGLLGFLLFGGDAPGGSTPDARPGGASAGPPPSPTPSAAVEPRALVPPASASPPSTAASAAPSARAVPSAPQPRATATLPTRPPRRPDPLDDRL